MADGFALLETMHAEGGRVALLERHLGRLLASAACLSVPADADALRRALRDAAAALPAAAPHRLRLLLHADGRATTDATPLADLPPIHTVAVYPRRLYLSGVLCRHKTTHRDLYDEALAWARARGADEALLLDCDGRVVEATRANVWVRREGRLLTPPLGAGGLPGVMRAHLLASRADAAEAPLTPDDLRRADEVLLSNALRGLFSVRLGTAAAGGA